MDASEKDLEPHFRFLSERLKENYDGYSSYVFTTTATIFVVIGWLLTSKDARAYIAEYPTVKWVMTTAILIFLAAEILFSAGAAETSQGTVTLIKKALKPKDALHEKDSLIEPGYYKPKIVPVHGVIIFVGVHAVLYGVLIYIIWSISPPSQGPIKELQSR